MSDRRKKLRKIHVDGHDYLWSVTDNNCDGDGSNRFKVWLGKDLLINRLLSGRVIVSPKVVREYITALFVNQ